MNPKLTAERLERGAIVYIRQSTPGQVLHHQEGRRRQYALEDQARQLGFQRVSVIDEDLGRSGSGLVERAGFQQLVGAVGAGAYAAWREGGDGGPLHRHALDQGERGDRGGGHPGPFGRKVSGYLLV